MFTAYLYIDMLEFFFAVLEGFFTPAGVSNSGLKLCYLGFVHTKRQWKQLLIANISICNTFCPVSTASGTEALASESFASCTIQWNATNTSVNVAKRRVTPPLWRQ